MGAKIFNVGYFDIPDTDPDSDLFNPAFMPGDYVIGNLTISSDAQGIVRLALNDAENAGTAPPEFIFEIVDGQVIPEPSSAVLAVIGLIGLAGVRRRRRA